MKNIEQLSKKFQKDGYVILRGFLQVEAINHLLNISNTSLEKPSTNYGSGFERLRYDVGNESSFLLDLIQDSKFGGVIREITDQDLLYTQGLAFELRKEKSEGFPWHVGTQSFGFQRKEDFGCTMWIPLTPINKDKQRGGMKYVSKRKFSGEFIYDYINLLPEHLEAIRQDGKNVDFGDFYSLKNDILNSPKIKDLLDYYAEEDSFEVGDVILFDKYTLHRSVRLETGPLESRTAFAMRFASRNSVYDKCRALNLEYPKVAFDYAGSSSFNIDVCQANGEAITSSPMFRKTLDRRLIVGS